MSWTPLSPDSLPRLIAERLAARPGLIRVAVDGPPCAHPDRLADDLVEPLRTLGRPAVHVRSEWFWRDASLRLEYGHEDLESFRTWLDADALRREVLSGDGAYLPSLRDPVTNRSTREPQQPLPENAVLIVSGALLLTHGLPFDVTVHLALSAAALARRLDPSLSWTRPAYEATAELSEGADIVIRMDDPRHPAARGLA